MKCIVFGGGGFIGSTIVDHLLKAGHAVKIFERPRIEPYRQFGADEAVEWVYGDLSSSHDVGEALIGSDVVFHLVSTTLPKSSNDDPIYDVQSNLVSTLQMLEAMVLHGVGRIIFISSGGTVYGNPSYLPIDENHPTNPLVSYGITKLAIEKYLQIYEKRNLIKSVTLRVSNPYGERQRVETAQGAVGVFLNKALTGTAIEIWGDGSVQRDYIHVQDVAEAFVKALSYTGPHRIFNISSGVGTSLNELVTLVENVLGKKVVKNNLSARSFDVPVSILSNKLAASELDWCPKIKMHDGIIRTSAWMKIQLKLV